MIDLSIIIVNWNSTAYLLKCVESIYEHTRDAQFEIIVVDNCSPDGDADMVKRRFPDVELIQSSLNLGFSRANNLAFRSSRGEFLVFLNPDTVLINPAFDRMLQQVRTLPHPGAIGCTLLNGDLSVQTSAIQTFPTIANQLLDIDVIRNRFPACPLWNIAPLFAGGTNPSRAEVISGACLMMRRDLFKQIGCFSEDYFMYAEDLDLSYKAVQAGYVNYYLPQGRIIHYGGKSSNLRRATVLKWQSDLHYFIKHRGYGYSLAFRFVMSCGAMLRLAALISWAALSGRTRRDQVRDSLLKWRLILKTMLAYSEKKQQAEIVKDAEAVDASVLIGRQ